MKYEALHLDQGENVILEVRKHWIVFAEHALILIFAGMLPFIMFAIAEFVVPEFVSSVLHDNDISLFSFLYSVWLLILWLSFFVSWTKYYLDVWYVTEKRIIAVDQKRIFHREVSNIRFDKVQDVTVKIPGFIATFLDYGNVKVQTASEDAREFYMSKVGHPQEVRRVIFNQQNRNSETKWGV